jgi:transcriptional regulator with XRE-family HTH domain
MAETSPLVSSAHAADTGRGGDESKVTSTDRSAVGRAGSMSEDTPVPYARMVGENLRKVRRQQGLALREVEEASGREFKASVVGAYERGERIISVPRLQRLARLYGVPVDQLLPSAGPSPVSPSPVPSERVRVDLARLAALDSPESGVLRRYVTSVQIQRGDFNGRVITIRDEDVRSLGRIILLDEAATRARLRGVFVIDPPPQYA